MRTSPHTPYSNLKSAGSAIRDVTVSSLCIDFRFITVAIDLTTHFRTKVKGVKDALCPRNKVLKRDEVEEGGGC